MFGGHLDVESMRGNKYFVTIDNGTRKIWVYLLQSKNQVFQCFQQFHIMGERKTRLPLKYLRSNNREECTSQEFKAYCSNHGVRYEKTVPNTSQHNGVVERTNRKIVEKVCAYLEQQTYQSHFGEKLSTPQST